VNVRKEELEAEFEVYLEQLKPKHEYLRLFTEIILDVWKQKQMRTASVRETLLPVCGKRC
jgi:hypothetical protein